MDLTPVNKCSHSKASGRIGASNAIEVLSAAVLARPGGAAPVSCSHNRPACAYGKTDACARTGDAIEVLTCAAALACPGGASQHQRDSVGTPPLQLNERADQRNGNKRRRQDESR